MEVTGTISLAGRVMLFSKLWNPIAIAVVRYSRRSLSLLRMSVLFLQSSTRILMDVSLEYVELKCFSGPGFADHVNAGLTELPGNMAIT